METNPAVAKVTRRRLLSTCLASGIAGAISPFGVGSAAAQTEKAGGLCRFGVNGASNTDDLDPANARDSFVYLLHNGLRNCLTEIGTNGELSPELAETWESNRDATEWVFKLRKGVEFHSGKALVSEDVAETFKFNKRSGNSAAQIAVLNEIAEIKTDGPTNIIFRLASGSLDFPNLLSHVNFAIAPYKNGGIDVTSGDGTGGYSLKRFTPGVVADLVRNRNYWKTGRAHFEEAQITGMNDATARMNALQAKDLDAINRVPPTAASLLGSSESIKIVTAKGTLHYSFAMNTSLQPFGDNNVRLALKHLVNRQQFLDTMLNGYGTVADDNPIAESYRFYNPNLQNPHTYDPDKAKFYLRQAGLSSLQTELFASDAAFEGAVDASSLFAENAAAAGVKISPVRAPSDGYWSDTWGKKSFFAEYWAGRPTEDSLLTQCYSKSSSQNATHWDNARFNELLEKARGETNLDTRREMYAELQQILHDESGTIVVAFADHIMGTSPTLQTGTLRPSGYEFDSFRAMERWSFS